MAKTTVSIRELQRDTSGVVARVMRTGRPAIVTNRGEPVAAVVAIDPDLLEDFVLANAPSFVRSMGQADRELAAGQTRPLDEVLAEIRETRHLTDRESEILNALQQGRSASAIARELDLSTGTVRTHIRAILHKLGVNSRTELVERREV